MFNPSSSNRDVITTLKEQWGERTKNQMPDPQARYAAFQNMLDKDNNRVYWDRINAQYALMGKQGYTEIFEEDYYSRFGADRPSQDKSQAYQTGKFHQVLQNGLYTLEAFSHGFIGCLIGSLFIGTGMMMGTFAREMMDLEELLNQEPLADKDANAMCQYIAYKMHLVLGAGTDVKEALGLNSLDFDDDKADAFEKENMWTNDFQERLSTHFSTYGSDVRDAQSFAGGYKAAIDLMQEKQDVGFDLRTSMIALLSNIQSDDVRNKLAEECGIHPQECPYDADVDNKKSLEGMQHSNMFTPAYNQFKHAQEEINMRHNGLQSALLKAATAGSKATGNCLYDYLIGNQNDPNKQNSEYRERMHRMK